MWLLFKLINIFWLLASTYFWVTALLPIGPLLVMVNVAMIICLGMLSLDIRLNRQVGLTFLFITLITIWFCYIDGIAMGITTLLMYMPAIYIMVLPAAYQQDLLDFTTKWYAILLIPGLFLYGITQFVNLPSLGEFVHPNYPPYLNYVLYIKTTFDYGHLERFNSFFLEPGHQALLSTFLLMANRYRFMKCKWLWILGISIILSFSLAGYLLALLGFILLKIRSVIQVVVSAILLTVLVIAVQNFSGGNNALNDMIISRLERDESSGIKGNNRFAGNTDFVYQRSVESGEALTGVKERTNMELIAGAGYKIYIINYGYIGTLLALFIYLSMIPSKPDYRYTISFLIILILCFLQRAYPAWYSWLFPYVIGIYLAKAEKEPDENESAQPADLSTNQ
ncbi:MAG: hypothetical protein K2H38_00620 [Muribaculaceae bacterium]|nr:hypothetical protein [Muribaculaceae bacterium]